MSIKKAAAAVAVSGAAVRLASLLQHLSGTTFNARADARASADRGFEHSRAGCDNRSGFFFSDLTVFASHVGRSEAHLLSAQV